MTHGFRGDFALGLRMLSAGDNRLEVMTFRTTESQKSVFCGLRGSRLKSVILRGLLF